MAILMDNIIPSFIVGILIMMIFRLNAFMLETQVDNRLVNEMQHFSELAVSIVHEELRTANQLISLTDDSIEYDDINGFRVTMKREDQLLVITKTDPVTLVEDITTYPTYLSDIEFKADQPYTNLDEVRFLRIKLMSESNPEAHARFNNSTQTAKAFSEKQVFLRNVVTSSFQL